MTALPEYVSIMDYDAHGRPVCADHHRRICHDCAVDFTYDGDEEFGFYEHGNYGDDEAEGEENEDDERVFVLGTGVNRFMPQWDEEILGPGNTFKIKRDLDNPPKPLAPDKLHLHYCVTCQVTWLKGNEGIEAVQNHPSHHTYQHIYAGTRRSLIVFTDGACPSNGTTSVLDASIGVYFGPGSRYNLSEQPTMFSRPTSQVAEISAAIEALRQVHTIESHRRHIMTKLTPRVSEDQSQDLKLFRLVVATDSSYVVECMSKHIGKWTIVDGVYRNEKGNAVENSGGFVKLSSWVTQLSMVGVQVVWYHVPREFNMEADGLAQLALRD